MQEFSIYDRNDIAAGLQNFLICIEMFPAAVTHAYAFPPRDYLDPAQQGKRGLVQSLRAMFDVRDVMEDMNLVVDDTVRILAWVPQDSAAAAAHASWCQAQQGKAGPGACRPCLICGTSWMTCTWTRSPPCRLACLPACLPA